MNSPAGVEFEFAPELLVYRDRAALSHAAADKFIRLATEAIWARARFAVAFSGGSTPRDLYERLASPEFRERVEWSRVFFFWGDERAVPPDDKDSNYRMANETLLSKVPVPRENIFRVPAEKNPEIAAQEYARALREFFGNQLPRFDLILLGMGANAHTASLFPHTPVLSEKTRWVAATWVPELNTNRLTLTVPVINNAANILFLVTGADKAATLRAVLRGMREPERLPVQLIQPHDGKLLWMVDEAAASGLRKMVEG